MSKACWKLTANMSLNLQMGEQDNEQGALGWCVVGKLRLHQQAGSQALQ